ERPHDGAVRQADLEIVVPIALGAAQQDVRGSRECARVGALAAQQDFGRGTAPWLVCDATERQTGIFDRVAVELERCRDRYQCERIGQAVADLQVGIVRAKTFWRKL